MRAGSLSDVSTVTHTASRWSASTHCASAVVLPYPAGATSTTSGCADVKDSRSSSLERRTRPGRWIGADSLGPTAATVTKGRAPQTSEEPRRASPPYRPATDSLSVAPPEPFPSSAPYVGFH